MEKKKSKKRILAFVLYLFLGACGFLTAAECLTVPVYEEAEGTVSGERTVLCDGELPGAVGGEPILLYETDGEAVERIEAYRVEKNKVQLEESTGFADGTAVRLKIPTGRVTVLWSVFRKGGAL